jgi:hypothetical protein
LVELCELGKNCIAEDLSGLSFSVKPGSTNGNTSPLKIRLATSGITKIAKVSGRVKDRIYINEIYVDKRKFLPRMGIEQPADAFPLSAVSPAPPMRKGLAIARPTGDDCD